MMLGACANTETPDSGWNVGGDAARGDATSMGDAPSQPDARPMDAPRDVPRDTAPTMDTGVDVPRDVPRDVPVDRGTTPPDTGVGRTCAPTCATDVDCMSTCPATGAGYVNCCLQGTGGGTCYMYMGSACPSMTPTDAGGPGSDSGFPLGGGPGAPCTMDSQCSMGSTCCSLFSPDFGVCGCSVPGFGCAPAFGSSC
jgi:hypothetical protein